MCRLKSESVNLLESSRPV